MLHSSRYIVSDKSPFANIYQAQCFQPIKNEHKCVQIFRLHHQFSANCIKSHENKVIISVTSHTFKLKKKEKNWIHKNIRPGVYENDHRSSFSKILMRVCVCVCLTCVHSLYHHRFDESNRIENFKNKNTHTHTHTRARIQNT